jgi:uncharacterized membrane protein YbaN (DUF454 family)
VALAFAGVFVPGLPVTVFLLAASWFFARSSPRFENFLVKNRWFGPYLQRFRDNGGLSWSAKAGALVSMWTAVTLSSVLLAAISTTAALITIALGFVGTLTVMFGIRTAGLQPREIVQSIEQSVALPSGEGDRFAGYAVIGVTFRSGHVLALRRFPASSVGPGYTSVWHRNPSGVWTFYSTVPPEQGCSRYFGGEIHRNIVTPIEIMWSSPTQFRVRAGEALDWTVTLTESAMSRMMNAGARAVPESWWQKAAMLKAMGHAARFLLGTGRMNLAGTTPNGYEFVANPQRVWLIDYSRAVIDHTETGPIGPLTRQAHLNDFLIPQRGVFAIARAFMTQLTGFAANTRD